MNDLWPLLQDVVVKYVKKLAEGAWELLLSVFYKAVKALSQFFAWLDASFRETYSRLSWYEIVAVCVVAAALLLFIVFRRRIYQNFLIYNVHWLRFRGYSRQTIRVNRAGKERRVDIMGLAVPLPERFASLRVYKAVPDRYVVAYGAFGRDKAAAMRDYASEGGLGFAAMRRDFAEYFKRTAKFQNPASETRELLECLAATDPGFAQNEGGRESASRPPYWHVPSAQ